MENFQKKIDITKNYKAAWIAGFLFMILGVILGYYFSTPTKKLSYTVDESEERKSTISINPRTKILFDNVEVKNIVVAEIAIWNSGSQTIDSKDILSLAVRPTQEVKILSADQIVSSRKSLKINTSIIKDENNFDVVNFSVLNEDALETSDGGIFQIVYSGEINADFLMEGRIKGINSFSKMDWKMVPIRTSGWWTGILVTFIGILGLALIGFSFSLYREKNASQLRKWVAICLIILYIPMSIFMLYSGYQRLSAAYYLSWFAKN